jgi:membrane-bound metal-dependent hydrolase YbcI (DUF457 family)
MTRNGHRFVGVACGLVVSALLYRHIGIDGLAALPAGAIGGNAPDSLEWIKRGKVRWCAHRTITHWWPWWLIAAIVAIMHLPSLWSAALLGYAIGGLSHLLFDWPNATGIPFLHPWDRRSLRLWNSGEMEWILLLIVALLVLAFFMALWKQN